MVSVYSEKPRGLEPTVVWALFTPQLLPDAPAEDRVLAGESSASQVLTLKPEFTPRAM